MGGLIPAVARACTFKWNPGFSPDEIKERTDIRKVKGAFRIVDLRGTTNSDGELQDGIIYGRIVTRQGGHIDTFHHYSEFAMQCGADRRPVADGTGTFWIKMRPVKGQHEMMLWEGEYLPQQSSNSSKPAEDR